MACKCAKPTDEYHGWECDVTGGECAFIIPDSKLCAKIYGEGPDAVEQPSGKWEGMERLTTRTDICCEPENDIVYYNPKDPDGLYNIIDLAKCVHEVDGEEANILLEISNRLAAYEDIGLTPAQVEAMKMDMEQLRADNINAEMNLAHMTADKDEQAGRIMQQEMRIEYLIEHCEELEYLLRRTLPILEVTNDQQGLIDAINAMLGGTKDKPLKPAGKYETFAVPGKAPVIQGETAKISELGGKEDETDSV